MDERTRVELERIVRACQAEARIPALTVAVHRADRPLWTFTVGESGHAERPLSPASLFRMGSITKTFTAVAIMQCRDDGLLDLDDPISRHVDAPAHGDLTIRRLLSHTAGLQREPFGDVWDTLVAPNPAQLLADLARVERVLPSARRFHYSNLGFALLGHLVGKVRGVPWAQVLTDRVLEPLGLTDVTVDPAERAVVGYLIDAYSDHAHPEPVGDFGAVGPAASLWATAADLARWGAFLADPVSVDPSGAVLAASTVEEMRWPITPRDEALWVGGFGLGLIMVPRGDRIVHVGHDGAMPGFLAGAYGRRGGSGTPKAFGAAVLGSSGTAGAIVELPHRLLETVAKADPPEIEPWRAAGPVPAEYRGMLGRWWSEGSEFIFFWRDGALRAQAAEAPAGAPPAVFGAIAGVTDELRTVSGREVGERLRLHRDPATGVVIRMNWATYRVTREQEAFDGAAFTDPRR